MRHKREVTITAEGRDKDKKFLITEMGAMQGEKWATRALLALGRSGLDIPDDFAESGFAGLAVIGIRAISSVDFVDAEPLMDEMMECVQRVETKVTRKLVTDDIEEVATIWKLRVEALELHTGFSLADALSKRTSAAAQGDTSNTETSPAQ